MTRLNRWFLLAVLAVGFVGCGGDAQPTNPIAPAPAPEKPERIQLQIPPPLFPPEPAPPAPTPAPKAEPVAATVPAPASESPISRTTAVAAIRISLQREETELRFNAALLEYLARCEDECVATFDERATVGLTLDYLTVLRRARAAQAVRVEQDKQRVEELRRLLRTYETGSDR